METVLLGITCLLVAALLMITMYISGKLQEIRELQGHLDESRIMLLKSLREYGDLINTAKEIVVKMEEETTSYQKLLDSTNEVLAKMDSKLSAPAQPKKQRGRPRKNTILINS
jgi:cell division protein ZapA (FtsZ GTPase activity inhibitor)